MGVDIQNNMTSLTKKPQSRNDQAAAEAMNNNGDKNKASNLNVSLFFSSLILNLFLVNY
jgi:hypothetical protein